MLRLGWFSTGRGPGSRNLLKAVMDEKEKGTLDIEIPFVFCNWDNTEEPNPKREQRNIFFDMVKGYGIPLVTESWKNFKPELRAKDKVAWGVEYGKVLREKTGKFGQDIGILAGYMLWMDDETCDVYDMLNLHPALPDGPKGTWQEVIWELMRNNADRQGVMIHICTKEHDRGDALTYCGFDIKNGEFAPLWNSFNKKVKEIGFDRVRETEGENEPLFRKIREEGAKRELPLIVSTIRLFSEGTVCIKNKKLWHNGVQLDGPYDLSVHVDEAI